MTPQEIQQDIQRHIWKIERMFGKLNMTKAAKQDEGFVEWLEKRSGKRRIGNAFR